MIAELLEKLISFKTTADRPEEIKKGFEYIASLFDPQKFNIKPLEKNGKHSLLVSFKGKDAMRPKILLNGHFDVVPAEDESQYKLRLEGSSAYGRGTVDMKGMATVLIEVMQEIGEKENTPDVALLLNGDEEVGGENGAGYCARELGMNPQFFLCADGPDEHSIKITTREKGVLWLELVAKIQKLVPEVTLRALEKGSLLFVEENNSFLQQFKKAAESVVGREVPLAFEHGATDARYFAEVGVPCAVFGAIGGNMHAAREWVDIKSLEQNREILSRFLQD